MLKKSFLIIGIIFLLQHSTALSQNFLKKFVSVGAFTNIGNTLYFAADDGSTGVELWKTDGTTAGTVLVKDINTVSSSHSSNVAGLFVFKGKLYFSANDGVNGIELWTSDGTAAGTVLLKDICTVRTGNNGSQPAQFTISNGMLYFTASEGGTYSGLWRTDGTAAGTIKLTDDDYLGVSQLTRVGQSLYFTSAGNRYLWKTDGTAAGTKQVTTDDYYTVDLLKNVNNELVFITNTSYRTNIRLYKLNPADDKLVLLQSFNHADIDHITQVGTGFYFSIRVEGTTQGTDALWKSDKTAAGTTLIKSYGWTSYLSGSSMENFISYNNKLYFSSTSTHNLYTTDGTAAGTVKVSDAAITQGSSAIISNQKIYFSGNNQLWSYDGAVAKQEFAQPTSPTQLYDVNSKVYFTVGDNFSKTLWNNDASPELSVVKDYQTLLINSTSVFTSKKDSAAISNITITNSGNKPLILSEISVTGNSFYVSGKCDQALAVGKQANFKLIYYPTHEEVLNGILTIKSNDNTGVFTANLTGTAIGTAHKPSVLTYGIAKNIVFNDTQPSFSISNNTIAENLIAGSVVGSFQIAGTTDPYTYSFIAGDGDADNSRFNIINGQLKSAVIFDYETKNTYSVRVKATGTNSSIEKAFVIQVGDVQESTQSLTCAPLPKNLTFELNDVGYFGTALVAVGSDGRIIKSINNGQDWTNVNAGYNTTFFKISVTDDHTGYVFGSGGTILKTENSGDTWFALNAPSAGNGTMYFYSDNIGFVVGDGGIFKTVDGGKNWIKQISTASYGTVLNSVWFTDENNGFICGSSQTLLRTHNGGNTWESVTLGTLGFNTNLASVTFVNANTGYVLSVQGDVLQTKDGGTTWTRISTVANSGWNGPRIYFKNETEGYIVSLSNLLYKTTNGGQTWSTLTLGNQESFTGLAINKANNTYCIVGHGVYLGSSGNQGSAIYLNNGTSDTWVKRSSIGNDSYVSVNFADVNTGYVFGTRSFKTADGGITWLPLNVTIDSYEYITSGYFINKDVGFYCDVTKIYRTADGGRTWVKLNVDDRFQGSKFYFLTDKVGFVTSENGYVFKTTDGGITWQKGSSTPGGLSFGVYDVQFLDAQTGYTVALNSINTTTDSGNTWTSKVIGGDNSFLLSVHFFDTQTGLIGGNDGLLLRTTDGGATWATLRTPMTLPIKTFAFTSSLHGYAFCKYPTGAGEIYETQDGGLTWTFVLQNWDITNIQQLNNDIYMCGGSGAIMKLNAPQNSIPAAGYITGTAKSQVLTKTNYTVSAIANTSWQWAVSGPADVDYRNNLVNITWKQAGNYTIMVTPVTACGNGAPTTLNVIVSDTPKPVITSYYLSGTGSSTVITITGDNFSSATQLSIGGIVLPSFIVSSPTSISAPLGSTAMGNIAVTNPGGTTVFNYAPPPVITSLSTMGGIADATITITGHDFTGITDVSFGITSAKSFTVNSSTSITATLAAGSSGDVSVTGTYGVSTISGFLFYSKPAIIFASPTSAGAGATVYIYGSNFTGATAVNFGGVAAQNFTVNSPGLIIAKVAANSTSGNIDVTTPAGTASSSGFIFTVPPVISSVNYGNSGSNLTVTIIGSNFNNVYSVYSGNVPATSFMVNSPTNITATFAATATGNITVTSAGGSTTFTSPPTQGIQQTIAFSMPGNATYGDADLTLAATSTNAGIPITYTSDNNIVATIVNGKLHIVNAGTANIIASQAGDATHNAAIDIKQTLLVSPKAITVAADAKTKIYGDADPVLTYRITNGGLVGADAFAGALTRDDGESVNSYAINKGSLYINSNYMMTYVGAGLVISPKTITISADAKTKTYGDADPPLTYRITNGSLVGTDAFTGVLNRDAGETVNTYAINKGTVSLNGNYMLTYVGTGLTVQPKSLQVIADNYTRAYGQNNPTFTVTYNGFINGEDASSLTAQPLITTTASGTSPEGVYDLVPGGGRAVNYVFAYMNGKLTIRPAISNFKVSSTSVSCKGQNNGSITISPAQVLNYTAVVTGGALNQSYQFTGNLNIPNLSPGTYHVCISVAGIADYSQCFDLPITEPQDLSVYTLVNKTANTVELNLSGSTTYNITINGKAYTTNNNNITLPLNKGSNSLSVSTDKPCQGSVNQVINGTDNQIPYPNPFSDVLFVNLGENALPNCTIKIYSLNNAQLKFSQSYDNQSGVIKISVANLHVGYYALHIIAGNKESVYKIVKQ